MFPMADQARLSRAFLAPATPDVFLSFVLHEGLCASITRRCVGGPPGQRRGVGPVRTLSESIHLVAHRIVS